MRILHARPFPIPNAVVLFARHGATDLNERSKRDPLNTPVQGQSLHEDLSRKGEGHGAELGAVTLAQFLSNTELGFTVEITRTLTSGALRGKRTLALASLVLRKQGIAIPAPDEDIRLAELYKGDAEGKLLRKVQKHYTAEQIALREAKNEGWDFRHGSPASPGESARDAALRGGLAILDAAVNIPAASMPGVVPVLLVINHNLHFSHSLAMLMDEDPPFNPNARHHMTGNGHVHVGLVYDEGIYFRPELLTPKGAVECPGCLQYSN